jgi:hypothetical protein
MYEVPKMVLIPQKNNTSCWYASAQMLIQWKRSTSFFTFAKHPDPSQVGQIRMWEIAGNGLVNPRILVMAKLLGLKSIPPLNISLGMLEDYLRHYGPLWTNGKEHIVVIAGVDQANGKVLVYDPWKPNVGKVEWRSFSGWYLGGTPPGPTDPDSSQDSGQNVPATFLYHP